MRPCVSPLSPTRILSAALLAGAVLLSGCGGGGGSATPHVPVVYTDLTSDAVITSVNAQEIYQTVWDTARVAEEGGFHKAGTSTGNGVNGLFALVHNAINNAMAAGQMARNKAASGTRAATTHSEAGAGGNGIRTITVDVDGSGDGTINVVYSSYSDGTFTLDGMLDVVVIGYGSANPQLTVTLTAFQGKGSGSDYLLDGTVISSQSALSEALRFNIDGLDNVTGLTFRLADISWISIYDISITNSATCRTSYLLNIFSGGGIFVENHGKVTVNTPTSITYATSSCVDPHPDTGTLVITGADGGVGLATITMTVVSAAQYRLDVDADGDGTPVTGSAQNWGAF